MQAKRIERADGGFTIHVYYDRRKDDWRERIDEARRALDPEGRAVAVLAFPATEGRHEPARQKRGKALALLPLNKLANTFPELKRRGRNKGKRSGASSPHERKRRRVRRGGGLEIPSLTHNAVHITIAIEMNPKKILTKNLSKIGVNDKSSGLVAVKQALRRGKESRAATPK